MSTDSKNAYTTKHTPAASLTTIVYASPCGRVRVERCAGEFDLFLDDRFVGTRRSEGDCMVEAQVWLEAQVAKEPQVHYEIREQLPERPEASRLLRNADDRGLPLSFTDAMALAQCYSARGVAAFVSRCNGDPRLRTVTGINY